MSFQAAIHGRLGRDPETRQTRNDNTMTTVSVAVDVTPNNAEQQETLWLSVAAFGRTGEALARHQKGDLVSLSGRVTLSRWTGQDGQEREQLQMTADSVISARAARPSGGRRKQQAQQQQAPDCQAPDFDDIPNF